MSDRLALHRSINEDNLGEGWLWIQDPKLVFDRKGNLKPEISQWVRRGGFLIVENLASEQALNKIKLEGNHPGWRAIPPDHEIMRSFHLLDSLPNCRNQVWQGYRFDQRLAIVGVPFSLMDALFKGNVGCDTDIDRERAVRIFVNIMMVALATDYKKDQIHLPEILKRLR